MMPLSSPSDAFLTASQMAAYEAGLARRTVRSTTDTSRTGTRNAMPVSFPLTFGYTSPTARAAPVVAGMMLLPAARPARQSLLDGPSLVFCVAVVACTVVISPSTMPKFSSMILTSGARQLVVHDAFDTTVMSRVNDVWLTPMTNIGASLDGAEITTRFAPPDRC